MSLAPKGPLETLIFMAIIDLSLPSAKTSFSTHRTVVISHNKAHLQLGTKCANCNGVLSRNLEIQRFDIVLKLLHFQIRQNDDNLNLTKFATLNAVIGNRTSP